MLVIFFFFFSSRRRHTRLQGDWSSDVCSSDLRPAFVHEVLIGEYAQWFLGTHGPAYRIAHMPTVLLCFLPWSLFLPAAVVWWRRSDQVVGRRYVLWWTITLWTLIGLSGLYRARY